MPPPQPWVGDGGGGDGGGGDDGRIFPEHPSPILHAPRDNISRKGKSLTPIDIYIYIYDVGRIISRRQRRGRTIPLSAGAGPFWPIGGRGETESNRARANPHWPGEVYKP